ncbi:MAG TPA: sensor histidine kinase [Candidatus Angelobacter sp.]|nr:sensor histidine kinase [Candidatus Angelobacter sp.]
MFGPWVSALLRVGTPDSGQVRPGGSTAAEWSKDFPRYAFLALLVAIAYYLGSKIGFALTPRDLPIATFWPPNAILLAAFLLVPQNKWWLLLLAVFPAHLLIQLPTGVPLMTACGWFISNSAEALLGAACVGYFKKPQELFETVPGVLVYLIFAVGFAPLASSFVDAGVVVITGFGSGYWKLWTARLFSNMLADLTVAPTIIVLTLNSRRWFSHLAPSRIVEGLLLTMGIVVVSTVVFGIQNPTVPGLMYSPLPLVVWIVVRFGVGGLYPSLLAIAVVSIWNGAHGRDPIILVPMADSILGRQIFLCTIALPMILLAAVLAERKAAEESLRQSRGQLIDAQEQERRRIARELHDDIGQQLVLLELGLDQLRRQSDERLKPHLDNLYNQASATSAATRTISHGLHSAHLEFLGLVPAVRNLCETVTKETSIKVAFTEENLPRRLDPEISLCLYRVTQEALNNIARHSHAGKAAVQLHGRGKWILLDIADDGVGINAARERAVALGLASMQERVILAGGKFKLFSQPMRGTRIEASIPVSKMQS